MGIQMCFPGGRRKAFTASYDDGVVQDIRLAEIFRRYGIHATFNINSGRIPPEDNTGSSGILSAGQMRETYGSDLFEVACHTLTHPTMTDMPTELNCYEIIRDRENLEAIFRRPIRGLAYPNGSDTPAIARAMETCGIAYGRTVRDTHGFALPEDFLRWNPTLHHSNPELIPLLKKFLEEPVHEEYEQCSRIFYLWGHSYEFDNDRNWDLAEEFCRMAGGREDVWYATNIELYDYITAYRRLVYTVDRRIVRNPSATDVWIYRNPNPVHICIRAGETVELP